MRLAIDTNRYTDLCKGVDGVVETLEGAERVYVLLGVSSVVAFRVGASSAPIVRLVPRDCDVQEGGVLLGAEDVSVADAA